MARNGKTSEGLPQKLGTTNAQNAVGQTGKRGKSALM